MLNLLAALFALSLIIANVVVLILWVWERPLRMWPVFVGGLDILTVLYVFGGV